MAAAVRERPDPKAFYEQVMRNSSLHEKGFGEVFCWNAAYSLPHFLRAYQAWNDGAWLEWGVRYYEFIVSKLQTGPDGYKGWIGPYVYDPSVWCDVHVGDAILCDGLLDFALAVAADKRLSERYGKHAEQYIEIARKHVLEKWDSRGTFEPDGACGGYRSWNRYGAPGELKHWPVRDEVKNSRLSLPFNKQNDMAVVALKLHRLTGEERYLRRAGQIFAFHKSRMQLQGGCLLWNYWEPMGQADIDQGARRTRHWVGVHPERNYQAREVAQIVEAYHCGLVFDEQDIRRIVRTNLEVMWNGEERAPKFSNSNARLPGINHAKQTAGTLWTALADFDETIRRLMAVRAGGSIPRDAIMRAYFENVTCRRPPGFAPRHPLPAAAPFGFPFSDCTELNMAAALPAHLRAGEVCLLACNVLVPGKLDVRVRPVKGDQPPQMLDSGERRGQHFVPWKPSRPGNFLVRWTFNGGSYREAPVTVAA